MVTIFVLLSCAAFVAAEHSGAYSSPQYAKKLYPKKSYDTSMLLPVDKPPIPFKGSDYPNQESQSQESIARFDSGNDTLMHRSSFLESANNFFSSTGGQVVTSIAKDFIARSTGSSQVLSLNLTNLVILIVLKALILAAGFFGAGAWKGGHHYGRSLEDNKNASYISEDEILLYLSYLAGQQNKNYDCLYLLSCQRPEQAAMYSSGAELLLQGTKLFHGNNIDLEPYEDVAAGIKQAAAWGEQRLPCDTRYRCGKSV
ncbi:uncharacterized protein LOC115442741 isoform X2 [Manduca sexta]|uniref:uncharacterized protein LOC115442741 isoform X2 n=1 Tax=Manduca sexta TaxID=7130 RepID=UPI00188FFCCC|nr:uncharacterized protein LOC115442741 isoform X2 [Manduca sexta]